MKILIFGAGESARRFIRLNPAAGKIEIVGIVDNDSARWGEKFEDRYTIAHKVNGLGEDSGHTCIFRGYRKTADDGIWHRKESDHKEQ